MLDHMFKAADLNSDGKISFEEFISMLSAKGIQHRLKSTR